MKGTSSVATMRSLHPDSAAFTFLLGALVTLASFATDIGLPVLDATAASLGVTSGRAAYTLSVFILGFALGTVQVLVVLVGAWLSVRLTRRGVAAERLVVVGLAAVVASAVALLAATVAGVLSVGLLTPLAAVGTVGQGIVRPHTAQGALEPLSDIAALFDGHSSLAMTAPMAACALASVAMYVAVVRRAEQAATRSAGRIADRGSDGRFGLVSTQHQ